MKNTTQPYLTLWNIIVEKMITLTFHVQLTAKALSVKEQEDIAIEGSGNPEKTQLWQ